MLYCSKIKNSIKSLLSAGIASIHRMRALEFGSTKSTGFADHVLTKYRKLVMSWRDKMNINSKNLWWIVPLFFIIGWTIGFYFNIPNNITIEYGENVLTAIHDLKNISFAFNSACKN